MKRNEAYLGEKTGRATGKQTWGCGLMLILFSILLVVILFGVNRTSRLVRNSFGEPDINLNYFQQMKQTFLLYQGKERLVQQNHLGAEIKFVIEFAEPVRSVCERLEAIGAIQNKDLFCGYLVYSGLDQDLQAGQFTLLPHSTPVQIAIRLADARLKDVVFTVFAGWRLEEVAEGIRMAGFPAGPDELVSSFQYPMNDVLARLSLPANTSLEGYLCPSDYSVKPETRLIDLVNLLTECHSSFQAETDILSSLDSKGLSYHQAVTLASIIQRETQQSEEMARIASVFYNRLSQGMMLQTDPTVQYALGFDQSNATWWKTPLTFADLDVDSSYNTYKVIGLLPGPISSPSKEAILAAVYPEETPYLYFRAKCDGSMTHNFSLTYDEHLSKACP